MGSCQRRILSHNAAQKDSREIDCPFPCLRAERSDTHDKIKRDNPRETDS